MTKKEKFKKWIDEHKVEIALYGIGGVLSLAGLIWFHGKMVEVAIADDNLNKSLLAQGYNIGELGESYPDVTPHPDLGRDCVLKCFDEYTGEQIGDVVRCTEAFWNDMQDCE